MNKFNKIIREGDGKRIYKNLSKLVSFGDRYAGSEADNNAAKFLEEEFEKLNFKVINEEFEGHIFEEFESTLVINDEKFACRAMSFSIPCKEFKSELIFVSHGEDEDYEGLNVEGKIVVALRTGDKDGYWEDVSRASKYGAQGFILINNHQWPTITTLETGYFDPQKRLLPIDPNPIPAIVVGKNDGDKIISLINNNKKSAKFKIDAYNGKRSAVNLRAIKKGLENENEKIIIYGHRDTVGTPGANDNGSGTVVMLEVARLLQNVDLKRTVEMVSFSAEEHLGSEGSMAYLDMHANSLKQIHSSIELDMIGAGSKISVMSGGKWADKDVYLSEELTDYVINVAQEMGYYFEKEYSDMGTPDSGRFADMDVRTTWIWCPDDIHYHSPEDTLEKVDINKLKIISDVVATAVYNLANE